MINVTVANNCCDIGCEVNEADSVITESRWSLNETQGYPHALHFLEIESTYVLLPSGIKLQRRQQSHELLLSCGDLSSGKLVTAVPCLIRGFADMKCVVCLPKSLFLG
ncbi:hypothetical protein SAY86_018700 [Trapa natans]|uniref:Uncharacterized protein n=1 Tax=Trapa natans TaxID=22666 RepID=A0AAN7LD62_TRANT|nr:hypothetical protein SAY86_018700 [Trapa natans]